MEQRTVDKFHAKLGKNALEIFCLIHQVYSDDGLSRANVFLWYKRFLEGQFQQCSLHSSIAKEIAAGNSFQLS